MKCPKCGGEHVQISNERSNHGCLWFILLGWVYLIWIMIKWMVGITILLLFDWWMAIIKACQKKGYIWHCKKWFSSTNKIYYCHDCGHNFRG